MPNRKPVVLLFRDDKKRVNDWVSGLAVKCLVCGRTKQIRINIITRPGEKCVHRPHSFQKDIDYMENVSEFFNEEFMLCNLGGWLSHHILKLRQPSSEELSSVREHFPTFC